MAIVAVVLWAVGFRFVETKPAPEGQGWRTVVGLGLHGYWPWDSVVHRCDARLKSGDLGLDPNDCAQQLTNQIDSNWFTMTIRTAEPPKVF